MQKTKSFNTQGSNTELYSRERLAGSLEKALATIREKKCEAIYITKNEKSSAEAVMLDINEYEYLCQQLEKYNALSNDATDKQLSRRLDTIEQKIDAIGEGIDIIRDVK
ncbi:hypothetical protein [Sulfurimonas hydrogeniphila]|uniref:hypothetical protein n=1 Tax=Sulfurimonas hydrogeniphila TaxID=2509341 RepID=UPI00125FE96B|nr:hypothetical protein [Sulfurimonas hydrogeniphila]